MYRLHSVTGTIYSGPVCVILFGKCIVVCTRSEHGTGAQELPSENGTGTQELALGTRDWRTGMAHKHGTGTQGLALGTRDWFTALG